MIRIGLAESSAVRLTRMLASMIMDGVGVTGRTVSRVIVRVVVVGSASVVRMRARFFDDHREARR